MKLTPVEAAEMQQIVVKTKTANPVLGLLHDPEVADFYKEELEIIRKESHMEGEKTGAYNAKLQTAKRLKALGVEPQLIAQATELELSTIQNL